MEMAETGMINLEIQAVATHTCSGAGPETEALRPARAWSARRLCNVLLAGQGLGAAWNVKKTMHYSRER